MVRHLDRYAFLMEWTDKNSETTWQYQLLYYPDRKELEMHDVKNRRVFLKKSTFEHLVLEMMHPGSRVNILSRQLRVVDYGDESTRRALRALHEQTCLVAKITDLQLLGTMIQKANSQGLFINMDCLALVPLVSSDVQLRKLESKNIDKEVAEMASRSWENGIIVVELIGKQATQISNAIAHEVQVSTCIYAPSNQEDASCLVTTLRQQPIFETSWIEGSTIAIVKPHTFRDGTTGDIVNKLGDDFRIQNVRSLAMDPKSALKFCEVYRDAFSPEELSALTEELSSGLLLAMNVSSKDITVENSVECLRELCGPMDPDLGRFIRPHALRSQFGRTKTQNAVHCTDLEEDVSLEYNFLFKT